MLEILILEDMTISTREDSDLDYEMLEILYEEVHENITGGKLENSDDEMQESLSEKKK